MLAKLQQYQLRIKKIQVLFFQDKVEFLGKVVTKEGIATSTKKTEVVLQMATRESYTTTIISKDSKSLQKVCSAASRPKRSFESSTQERQWSAESQESFTKAQTSVNIHNCPDSL